MKPKTAFFSLPLILAAALALPAPLAAQIEGSEAGLSLSHYLTALADNPRDARALIGAGEAALALGDADAAMDFFKRAEAVEPGNGAARAGMARLWLSQGKTAEAIAGFDAAVKMGLPEAEIARDRGMAYDLRGDPRRAQRDYALATRRGGDDEATRRYALSLAISGDRDAALKLLDPLLIKQDRAAWRARAFVLAMSGDVEGARKIAAVVMPAVAEPMTPFFMRLRGLSPAQRAAAVHLGEMPNDNRSDGRYTLAEADRVVAPLTPAADLAVVRPGDVAPLKVAKVSTDPRRRPGQAVETRDTARAAREVRPGRLPAPVQVARVETRSPSKRAAPEGQPPVVTVVAMADPAPQIRPDPERQRAAATAPGRNDAIRVDPAPRPVDSGIRRVDPAPSVSATPAPAPAVSLASLVAAIEAQSEAAPAPAPVVVAPKALPPVVIKPKPVPVVVTPKPRSEPIKLAEKIEPKGPPVKTEAEKRAEKKAADKKIADAKLAAKKIADKKLADKKLAEAKAAEKKALATKKASPERIWAQIATGSNPAALAKDYQKLAQKSPAAFKGQSGWHVPFKGTRRLLVGPFATQKKAMEFLSKAGISGIPFESPAGMEISKLAAK